MTRPILTILLLASLSANGALFTLPKPPVLTSRVGLAWEPSPDTNVTGYNLYWGTNGTRSYTTVTNVGPLTNITVRMARVTNWIAATAYDGWGLESDYSEELVYLVPRPPANTNTNVVIRVECAGWLEASQDLVCWVAWPNPSTQTNPSAPRMFWRDGIGSKQVTITRSYM
jgi:hypothetical protein